MNLRQIAFRHAGTVVKKANTQDTFDRLRHVRVHQAEDDIAFAGRCECCGNEPIDQGSHCTAFVPSDGIDARVVEEESDFARMRGRENIANGTGDLQQGTTPCRTAYITSSELLSTPNLRRIRERYVLTVLTLMNIFSPMSVSDCPCTIIIMI